MTVSLGRVARFGRSRRGYELGLNLSKNDLPNRILDPADGPGRLKGEMAAQGFSVISIDSIYQFTG